ncbi:hypothetical protein [Streptomyces sp. ISL-94]|nr:hypothetical protein [Streptomyces sp. ISL-94]MBT2479269.1 hypothetical protein [Streptomyces sp. ISL-94]
MTATAETAAGAVTRASGRRQVADEGDAQLAVGVVRLLGAEPAGQQGL